MKIKSSNPKTATSSGYKLAHREPTRRVLRFLLRVFGYTLLAKLDRVEGLENVPMEGPGIVIMNHIAFIDSLTIIHVLPRHIVPLAKVEVYDYPGIGIIPRLWGVIPVHREEIDRRAVQMALEVLAAGEMILVAPEGTRSPALQRGKVGVAYLAARADVPVIPVAIDGSKGFPALRPFGAWKTPGAVVRIGKPFKYRPEYRKARHEELAKMTDEAMYIISEMLPEERRGVYHDLTQASQDTITRLT